MQKYAFLSLNFIKYLILIIVKTSLERLEKGYHWIFLVQVQRGCVILLFDYLLI